MTGAYAKTLISSQAPAEERLTMPSLQACFVRSHFPGLPKTLHSPKQSQKENQNVKSQRATTRDKAMIEIVYKSSFQEHHESLSHVFLFELFSSAFVYCISELKYKNRNDTLRGYTSKHKRPYEQTGRKRSKGRQGMCKCKVLGEY